MFEAEILGLKYCRLLVGKSFSGSIEHLKSKYDYIFIVCYDKCTQDAEFEYLNKNACVFDLDKTDEEIIKGFNSTSRNELRKTYKLEKIQFQIGYSKFDEYYHFYKTCEQSRNWYPVPEDELRKSLLFSIAYDGQLISGMSCYIGGDTIRVGRIFSRRRINSNQSITGAIYGGASKRIVYEICLYARAQGLKFVDLGGVDLLGNEKSGISDFKLSLGATVVPVKIGRYKNSSFIEKEEEIRKLGCDIT